MTHRLNCNIVDPMHEKVRLYMHNHIVKYDLAANENSHMLKQTSK